MFLWFYLCIIFVYVFQNLVVNCVGLKYIIVKKELFVCKILYKVIFKLFKKYCDYKESNFYKYDVNFYEMYL